MEIHMKLMRLLALLAACLFAMAAGAQQNPPAQESGEHKHGGQTGPGMMGSGYGHVKELSAKLKLTSDQQTKVKTIIGEKYPKKQDIIKNYAISKEDKH